MSLAAENDDGAGHDFGHGKPLSDRKFGLTLGALFLALAAVRWLIGSGATVSAAMAGLGAVLVVLGVAAPALLGWPNRAWMKLGLLMAAVVTPVVMLVIFALIFVPIALVFRARGRDALGLRRKPADASYWVMRDPPGPAPETMIHQF